MSITKPIGITQPGDIRMRSSCCLQRRQFLAELGGMAALTAGDLLLGGDLWAQAQNPNPSRIDVHAHYAPPAWVSVIDSKKSRGVLGSANIVGAFKDWTPAKSIEQMDQAGVATSIVSITTPGVWFGAKESPVEATRQLARQCNDF